MDTQAPRHRILLVEDDDSMVVALRDGFEYEGYAVTVARDGETALELAVGDPPALVVLDVMLPKKSGLDVCRELRARGLDVPILMLTARGQEIDKVLGLKGGADDYVTKPFGFLELLARIEALLRRAGATRSPDVLRCGDLEIDLRGDEVQKGGRPVDLSARELRLLRYLVEHRGHVVSREQLLSAVWDYDEPPLTRTVDVHVAKLRKKLEDSPDDPRYICTVHGLGYKFVG